MSQMKVVSLIGTVLVIPWEGILAFFWSVRGDTTPAAWLFLSFGILLNSAALLCSWFKPRLSAYWVFLNIAIGISILVCREWRNLVEPTVNLSDQLVGILSNAALCFFLPLIFAVAMLTACASSNANAKDRVI
jgi:hypothetical protein